MIVSLSISNFRSFSSEETFSLTASNRLAGSHDDHAVRIPNSDQRVLRIGVLYGANGAGKSNLFRALRYMKGVALRPREKGSGTGREPFRLEGSAEETSNFDLQFIVADHLYRFGFKVDDQRIAEEWLVEIVDGREKTVYERVTSKLGAVTVEAPGIKGFGDKLAALVTVGGPQNQSFLATVDATLDRGDHGEVLGSIIRWFKQSLKLISPDSSFGQLGPYLADNRGCLDFAGAFLKSVSTGIEHLQISKKEITEEELRSLIPDELVFEVLNDLAEDEDGKALIMLGEGNELLVERTSQNHYYRINIRAAHRSASDALIPFDLNDESDGTKRLLNLLPALHSLQTTDEVYFIDEIDRSLHPNLVWEFVNFFLNSQKERQAQVIVTTHESSLLDLELLRRDEIWFAEKDLSSASRLYALTDFNVRKDLTIRKHYLQGRFGAVPFMGNLDSLRVASETNS